MLKSVIAVGALVGLVACSDQGGQQSAPKPPEPSAPAAVSAPQASAAPEVAAASTGLADGELELPADYKSWPTFLSGIQKAETKQIRDIYLNSVAEGADAAPLPDGSLLVMEIYSVKTDEAGAATTDADGNMEKAGLSKIFVMGKNAGWGAGLPEGLANGSWVYAAYEADGSAATVDYNACRACHAPLGAQDYVHRYEEYLGQR